MNNPINEKWFFKVMEVVRGELFELLSSLDDLVSCVYVVVPAEVISVVQIAGGEGSLRSHRDVRSERSFPARILGSLLEPTMDVRGASAAGSTKGYRG